MFEFGYTYDDVERMTIKELVDYINANSRMLGYRMWKQSYLTGWSAMNGKTYPHTPQKASPELYPPPKRIPMPEVLKQKILKGEVPR